MKNGIMWSVIIALLLLLLLLRILSISIAWDINTDNGIKIDFATEASLFANPDEFPSANSSIVPFQSQKRRRDGNLWGRVA